MPEETPIESILGRYGVANVFQEIESILSGNESEAIIHTLGFVRAADLYQHPFRDGFHEYLTSSQIWAALAKLLQRSNFGVRSAAIYTVGKLAQTERAYLLSEAFPFFLDCDPINLPKLLFELVWLTREWNWGFIEEITEAKHYLKRWSLCQILDDSGESTETLSRFASVLRKLKCDSHPLIADEATFRLERVDVKLKPKLPKAEWRQEVKRISSLEPKDTFEFTAMRFISDRSDYTLDEFDQFVSAST